MLDLKNIPKVNLHSHLGGSLCAETFLDLAQEAWLTKPSDIDMAREMICMEFSKERTLPAVLQCIAETYPVLQTVKALERAAYEAAKMNALNGVAYLELRAAPSLHTQTHLSINNVICSILEGLKRAESEFPIICNFIVSLVRGCSINIANEIIDAAIGNHGKGVVGLDVAGDETKYLARVYEAPLYRAKCAGLGITIHAGEASGSDSIWNAVLILGATRIGHGIAAFSDSECIAMLKDREITLEICPTSNYFTGLVSSIEKHPILKILRLGVNVSIGDDDPATFSTNIVDELLKLQKLGLTDNEIVSIQKTGIGAAFCDDIIRKKISHKIADHLKG